MIDKNFVLSNSVRNLYLNSNRTPRPRGMWTAFRPITSSIVIIKRQTSKQYTKLLLLMMQDYVCSVVCTIFFLFYSYLTFMQFHKKIIYNVSLVIRY